MFVCLSSFFLFCLAHNFCQMLFFIFVIGFVTCCSSLLRKVLIHFVIHLLHTVGIKILNICFVSALDLFDVKQDTLAHNVRSWSLAKLKMPAWMAELVSICTENTKTCILWWERNVTYMFLHVTCFVINFLHAYCLGCFSPQFFHCTHNSLVVQLRMSWKLCG